MSGRGLFCVVELGELVVVAIGDVDDGSEDEFYRFFFAFLVPASSAYAVEHLPASAGCAVLVPVVAAPGAKVTLWMNTC